MTRRFSAALSFSFALLAPGIGLSGNAGTQSESLLQIADLAGSGATTPLRFADTFGSSIPQTLMRSSSRSRSAPGRH